ncbi:hypothetical protein, partial [Candidatus Parabeggiatoa sp. HSG14]|uniref:hypothetical protein n=1 Tax=Candidatus Parabeggiatoa sp. HSG14 TaxID=3055593 RepID=UPI0025A6AB21|nr:hypothetical protein [Thiotrichales bacterium HSG14]
MNSKYLLDTHALVFWINQENISQKLQEFLDEQDSLGLLMVSSISFWEIALLTDVTHCTSKVNTRVVQNEILLIVTDFGDTPLTPRTRVEPN